MAAIDHSSDPRPPLEPRAPGRTKQSQVFAQPGHAAVTTATSSRTPWLFCPCCTPGAFSRKGGANCAVAACPLRVCVATRRGDKLAKVRPRGFRSTNEHTIVRQRVCRACQHCGLAVQAAILHFHLKNVALLIPCLWQRSAVFAPASCSRRIPMICSSVNLDRFIVRLLSGYGLCSNLEENQGLRSHS